MLCEATESSAPFLHSRIKRQCDMAKSHGISGAHKDGPRAWNMVKLAMIGRERSEADKDFYRKAERFQRDHRLPDGCGPDEYSNKALAYLTKLLPHLPNEPTVDEVSEYLYGLMPKNYSSFTAQLKFELRSLGRHLDHMLIVERCRQICEEHKCKTGKAALVAMVSVQNDFSVAEIAELSHIVGMPINSGHQPAFVASPNGRTGPPWCDGCGDNDHNGRGCASDPSFDKACPARLWVNKEGQHPKKAP